MNQLNRKISRAEIIKRADELGQQNYAQTGLASIYGAGASQRPKLALVFMNPTQRNISSRPDWKGPRFPFIGVPRIWRLFSGCGLLDSAFVAKIDKRAETWSVHDALQLKQELERKRLYITNVIKETAPDSQMPPKTLFNKYESLLHDELELVQPELIIAFGLVTYQALTGQNIRLADIYEQAIKTARIPIGSSHRHQPVLPCYFPVGRGNPSRAMQLLKMAINTGQAR